MKIKLNLIIMILILLFSSTTLSFSKDNNDCNIIGSYSKYEKPVYLFNFWERYEIPAYKAGDKICICVEDLSYYGYKMNWDSKKRITFFALGEEINYEKIKEILEKGTIRDEGNIYESDVKISINANIIKSFNVGGYSLVMLDDLNQILEEDKYYLAKKILHNSINKNMLLEASMNDIFSYELAEYTCSNYQREITRYEFAGLLYKLALKALNEQNFQVHIGDFEFSDFKEYDMGHDKDIYKLKALGIINGISDSEFGVDNKISKQEACVILTRILSLTNTDVNIENENKFLDENKICYWAKESINFLYNNGIIDTTEENKVKPLSNLNYEDAIVLIDKFGVKFNFFEKLPVYSTDNLININELPLLSNEEKTSLIANYQFPDHIKNNFNNMNMYKLESFNNPLKINNDIDNVIIYNIAFSKDSKCLILDENSKTYVSNNYRREINSRGGIEGLYILLENSKVVKINPSLFDVKSIGDDKCRYYIMLGPFVKAYGTGSVISFNKNDINKIILYKRNNFVIVNKTK